MIRTLTVAVAAALTLTPVAAAADPVPAQAVVRREAGAWTADLTLDRDAPLWVFENSEPLADGRGWRLDQWRVETPGVMLETVDGRDVLRAADGGPLPRRVRLALEPRFVDLQYNYDPVLMFSNGAAAWYSEAFNLLPLASPEMLAGLPSDLGPLVQEAGWTRVTWSDAAGPVLFRGERRADPAEGGADTYVLFGEAEVGNDGAVATVADPGLPAWIADELADYSPRIAGVYADRLGPGANDGAAVMMSWNGPTAGRTDMAGSVLPGLIVMAFEGVGVTEPSTGVRNMARWFIGHESAHFWLGQVVRYGSAADSWIMEGGADLMAVRGLQAADPEWTGRAELQGAVDECIRLADGPISTAAARGKFRVHYGCGAVFALVAEAAQKKATGGDWFDFLKPLIDASREDGVLTRDEWLAALDVVSGDPAQRREIEVMLDAGVDDPAAAVASLLDRAGIAHRMDGARVILS